jgi:hypothetical protein
VIVVVLELTHVLFTTGESVLALGVTPSKAELMRLLEVDFKSATNSSFSLLGAALSPKA